MSDVETIRALAISFSSEMDRMAAADVELRRLGDEREAIGKKALDARAALSKIVGANIQSKVIRVDRDRVVIVQWKEGDKVDVSIRETI